MSLEYQKQAPPSCPPMPDLDTREWLLTNGLGSFSSGTVCDARTRTYHGWLMAALDPPDRCTLLLSHIDASLETADQTFSLGTNFWSGGSVSPLGYQLLRSFSLDPVPTWVWQQDDWQLTRQILMPYELAKTEAEAVQGVPKFQHRVLIRYRYQGAKSAILKLRPLIGDRTFHQQQRQSSNLSFSQIVEPQQLVLQSIRTGQAGTLWQLHWDHGQYHPDSVWYWNFHYPEETRRRLDDTEDLYSPGYFSTTLKSDEAITLVASVGSQKESLKLTLETFDNELKVYQEYITRLITSETSNLQKQLLQISDRFLAYRNTTASPTVIAGYPWFREVGRFTLMAIPGLTLTTGRFSLARSLLKMLGQYCHQGLIPNGFAEPDGKPIYNSIDTSLWWIETLGLYLEASQDWDFLIEQYSIVKQIYKSFTTGTLYNIRIDAVDGLVTWDDSTIALTWMDASVKGEPVTPRRGKPIEVNALWYSALCWANQWATALSRIDVTNATLVNQARRYADQAEQVKQSLQRFWDADRGYLFDTIEPDDRIDASIRPNAVLALSLHHCAFSPEQARQILRVAHDRLLTPYGLRTLDPSDPTYIGQYKGNVWQRELAYHQGTVWSWLLSPFLRAWNHFYAEFPLPFDWEPLTTHLEQQVCLGAISELFDGNAPHLPRGAIAQVVTVSELIRLLDEYKKF
jgi:predicted glycogen debranching enzyme